MIAYKLNKVGISRECRKGQLLCTTRISWQFIQSCWQSIHACTVPKVLTGLFCDVFSLLNSLVCRLGESLISKFTLYLIVGKCTSGL